MSRGSLIVAGVAGIVGVLLLMFGACGGGATPPTNTVAPPPTTPPVVTVSPPADGGDLVARGQKLAQENACAACHSTDGSTLVGPSWKGLYGEEVTLADGTTLTADDAYIIESIKNPNAKLVKGYQPNLMPQTFGQSLSDADISAMIAYIKTLH